MNTGPEQQDATLPPATVPYGSRSDATDQCGEPSLEFAAPPGYQILGELGRGGMGLVYKARHQGLNRLVALKVILAAGHASDADLARFRAEAEAIARLRHPYIVQVYDVGEHGGLPYFSLEFCPGGSLDRKLNGVPLTPREAAELVGKLASATHEAHQKGILHRDLKPANVLIAEDGTPKIADFGLAKRLDGTGGGQTASGAVMGTPSYMAPEQAGGKNRELSPATDIYALGAILYELLTGRPPFRAATPLDTLLQALENEPAPIRLLNPQVDRDLETICLKCLEKAPSNRYQSATFLAQDLESYLAGEPISVRSINMMERLGRTLQRSQIDAGFESWGTVLLWFAAIILGTQLGLFALISTKQSELVVQATQVAQFVLMGLVLWCYRSEQMLPTNATKKHLVSLWIAYLIARGLVDYVSQLLVGHDQMYDFFLYPYSAILSGFAFFVMGSSYWGWCYAFGLAFFITGAVLPFFPRAGPLAFGLLWAASLASIGVRLRARAKMA